MANRHADSSAKKHGQWSCKNWKRDLSCTYAGHSLSHYWECTKSVLGCILQWKFTQEFPCFILGASSVQRRKRWVEKEETSDPYGETPGYHGYSLTPVKHRYSRPGNRMIHTFNRNSRIHNRFKRETKDTSTTPVDYIAMDGSNITNQVYFNSDKLVLNLLLNEECCKSEGGIDSMRSKCWAIEMWTFCHFACFVYQIGALFTPCMAMEWWSACSSFIVNAKNTRLVLPLHTPVKIHMKWYNFMEGVM